MIEFRDVSLVYPKKIEALRDLNLRIEKGEFVFIVGPTGSGKSTLLKLIYHEVRPSKGRVLVASRDISKLKGGAIPRLRRNIGVVFQDFKLLPQKTVWENVAFALYVTGTPRKEIRTRVPEVLDLVGLMSRADAYPNQLSGGEQQRISIARAIADNPPILLADEPTGNLDPETSWEIIQLLSKINIRGTTVIVASHDMHIIDRMKRRVVALDNGTVARDDQKGKYYVAEPLEYAIIESFTAIRRNALMSVASVVTVAFSLGILGAFGLFTLGLNNAAKSELNKFEITVWLKSGHSLSTVQSVQTKIQSMDHVESVLFVPASETWDKVKEKWAGVNVEGVDPSSVMGELDHYKVRLDDPRYTALAAKDLKALPEVANVIEGQEVVEQVVGLTDIVRLAGLALAGILLLIAIFIISNTIRLMIYARRREINIMQLVGATNWFIRLPLVFEGTMLGVLGGALACLMVLGGSYYTIDWVLKIVPSLGRFSAGVDSLWVAAALVGLGWAIGGIGSLVSIQRFLKAGA